ncbi:hypothetical protein GPUN_1228 [Glaciecola punicea ACAM 611]|uniref:Uncharacterized protein n=1 Tax=Glaciecola punicea ACAM 611 TaxID=1121923 RepID=H5TAM5_9ALTE|nr:hypothetical protein GPUN_1228 [Glaciecola punicea ACAM 611]
MIRRLKSSPKDYHKVSLSAHFWRNYCTKRVLRQINKTRTFTA